MLAPGAKEPDRGQARGCHGGGRELLTGRNFVDFSPPLFLIFTFLHFPSSHFLFSSPSLVSLLFLSVFIFLSFPSLISFLFPFTCSCSLHTVSVRFFPRHIPFLFPFLFPSPDFLSLPFPSFFLYPPSFPSSFTLLFPFFLL